MSVIDTIVNAVAPQENENAHREARVKAKAAARPGDWLSLILRHHEVIEAAFAAIKNSTTAASRTAAQKHLAVLLTGHANAEESIIYPAMSRMGGKGNATTAYSEQATAKTEMAGLETLSPMSQDYLEKLEHIRDAVAHHVYQEENAWFLDLMANTSAQDQALLAQRYQQEFDRYVGRDDGEAQADGGRSAEGITIQHRIGDPAARANVPRD
jgi:hemerythrin superfamily protein